MRKFISILFAFVLVLCLVGCVETNETNETNEADKLKSIYDNYIYVWTDEETGVQYIVYISKGGIIPRFNADGTLYVSTDKGGE